MSDDLRRRRRHRVLVPALVAVSALALAGCGSGSSPAPTAATSSPSASPAAASTSTPSSGAPLSLQFRPVLQERAAHHRCPAHPAHDPAPSAPLATCSTDETTWYRLGPATLTRTDVASVHGTNDAEWGDTGAGVDVTFTAAGTRELAAVTGRLNENRSPKNQFAIVVDGRTVSSPQVTQGAITSGDARISFGTVAQANAFLAEWGGVKAIPTPTPTHPSTATPAPVTVLVDRAGVGPATVPLAPIPTGKDRFQPVETCSGHGTMRVTGGPVWDGHALFDSEVVCDQPSLGEETLLGPIPADVPTPPLVIRIGANQKWHVRITVS